MTVTRAVLVAICWAATIAFFAYCFTSGPSLVELAALLLAIGAGGAAFWATLEIQRRHQHWRQEGQRCKTAG